MFKRILGTLSKFSGEFAGFLKSPVIPEKIINISLPLLSMLLLKFIKQM